MTNEEAIETIKRHEIWHDFCQFTSGACPPYADPVSPGECLNCAMESLPGWIVYASHTRGDVSVWQYVLCLLDFALTLAENGVLVTPLRDKESER